MTMAVDKDKDLVWKKLSTIPEPLLLPGELPHLDSLSVRSKLRKYLGLTDAELDDLIDGYQSRSR